MTLGMTHVLRTRSPVEGKEFIHQLDDPCRVLILGIQLHRIDKLPSRVRQTTGMDHLRAANVVIASIAVGLQDALELAQKHIRPFSLTAHPEAEDHTASRRSILPELGLVSLAAPIMHLHINRRFIGLDITSRE